MKKLFPVLLTLTVAALCILPARAQTALGIVAQYGLDLEEFQLGGEFHIPFRPADGFSFVPNIEFYLRDDPTIIVINADVHYAFASEYTRSLMPYVGMGLAVTRVSFNGQSDSEAGLNLIGGANFRTRGRSVPFFQVEFRAGDPFDDLSIGGGVRFPLR